MHAKHDCIHEHLPQLASQRTPQRYVAAEKAATAAGSGTAQALRRVPDSKPLRDINKMPNLAQTVTLRILNLCLRSRDIPDFEKHGITTGLPKSTGLVTSTKDLRPISSALK